LGERWSIERAAAWYARQPWICGFNYLPRTAVNWTELWQAESFDLPTIEQELDWARDIGFNALRTNLQYLVWRADAAGLRARLDRFLGAAAQRGMRTLLCLFDDCAFSGREPHLGRQDDPVPGVHNGGAAASPGREVVRDRSAWPGLERYVRDLVGHFRDDARLLGWDLYNEPGNEMVFTRRPEPHPGGPLIDHSIALAEAAFAWARAAQPTQPLTSGVWTSAWPRHDRRLLDLCDVVSFHDYLPLSALVSQVERLRAEGRPLLCTEWLSRRLGSLPESHLPYFARERIGCFHWGLVNGRTQTHLPWPGFERVGPADRWHHDLLHPDGTPYDPREVALFREWCARSRSG
jgi:hypothetical protein